MLNFRVPSVHHDLWYAQDRDFKVHFGLSPTAKWPAEGMPPIVVNQVKLWVNPLQPGSRQGKARLMALCPGCGKTMSGGTFHQHVRTVHR